MASTLTQTELVEALSDESGFTKADTKIFLESLDDVVADMLKDARKVKIGKLVQLEPKVRPAQKKRMGRNPQTGEAIEIPRKPAAVVIRARVLKKAKDNMPTMQKVRRNSG